MASKQFYHDIDLVQVGQLLNFRIHNVTNAAQTTLEGLLGVGNKGLPIFNTDDGFLKVWDGVQFVKQALHIDGDLIFRGALAKADYDESDPGYTTGPEFTIAGSQYVISEAGAINLSGVTVTPGATVQVGDVVIFTAPDAISVIQRNDEQATETVLGNVKLVTTAKILAGVDDLDAVTALKLQQKLDQQDYIRGYSSVITTAAATPLNVEHNLNLVHKDAFTINLMDSAGSQVSADIDSVDVNNVTVTTLIGVSDIRVTITGIPADQ